VGTADNGNVTAITNNRDTTRSQSFAYDALNRISTAKTSSTSGTKCWDEAFGYDPWGNLLTIGRINGYTCSNEELLNVMATPQNRISGDTYDTAGNLTAIPSIATYTYNAENQMTVTAGVTYTYDGDGKRVKKSSGKLYWYGMGSDPLDETDLAGVTTNAAFKEYVFFGGKRIARRDSANAVSYYFADHLGTARIVANSFGAACYDSDFYPFGGERSVTNTCSQNYKFTGKERDSESGLDNFGARYDSSNLGRFMSPDPKMLGMSRLVNPQRWNKYAYTINNPLRYIDPDGKDAQETIAGLWHAGFQLREDIGRPLPYITQNNLSVVASLGQSNSWVAGGEILGGVGMIGIGLGGVISHGNPLGYALIVGGGGLAGAGFHSLRKNSSSVAAEFSAELEIFKFEQQILKLASEINPTSVRDFTPEELSEAKLAANSLLATGFLPNQIAEQVRNAIAIINAEFNRREEEARKKDEEERKKRCESEGKKDCV
jgi:RHS repeat-associated protein